MKKPESIQFILSASKILSVNSLYNAKIMNTGRRPFATIYKSGEAKKTEAYIKDQVKALGELPAWITKDTRFDMVITVIFKSGLLRRDLDNTIKLIQDGIFRALGVNDSHVMSIRAYKTLCPGIQDEKICIQLSEAVREPRFDKLTEDLPSPRKIYMGGTLERPWWEELIPELDRHGISYILPTQSPKADDSMDCECEIYVFTPGTIDVFSATKFVSSVHEAVLGHYGSVLIGLLGKEESWGEDVKKTKGVIESLASGSPRIKMSYIENPKEILGWIKIKKHRK